MSENEWYIKWLVPGEIEVTHKHLQGKHNQKRHGWRFHGDSLANARSAMRGQSKPERDEYRKRAGMAQPKKVERQPRKMTEGEVRSTLEKHGGKYWEKGNYRRVYFNGEDILEKAGLKVKYYNTGNISSATFRGNAISNSEARRMFQTFSGKFFYDFADGKFYSKTSEGFDRYKEYWDEYAKELRGIIG